MTDRMNRSRRRNPETTDADPATGDVFPLRHRPVTLNGLVQDREPGGIRRRAA